MGGAIVLLSGGMDSGVLLASLRRSAPSLPITCLSFTYGAKHNHKEISCAKILAEIYDASHLVIPLPDMSLFLSSSLLQASTPVPEGRYAADNMLSTIVPFRNGILLSFAVAVAEDRKMERVFIATHGGDHFIYPDCRATFISGFNEAAAYGTQSHVNISAPYLGMSKTDIALIGRSCDFPFGKTWSCYKGEELHCGKCGTCVERKEALSCLVGGDPTVYAGD